MKLDVLVLDLMMPGLSGLEALRILRERSPRTRVVIGTLKLSTRETTRARQEKRSVISAPAIGQRVRHAALISPLRPTTNSTVAAMPPERTMALLP